jgi:SAM-dependent methyltransferase
MFVESAAWIGGALSRIEFAPGTEVLDIGSATEHYRTVEQPHVQREVMAPLEARGARLIHLDAREADGVDVVCDMDRPDLDLPALLGKRFDVVLCAGLLSCVSDPAHTVAVVREAVAPGGYLIASTPESYRRTLDPGDNKLRPTPRELGEMFGAGRDFEVIEAGAVRIDDGHYYRGLVSRPMWFPLAGRWWIPLPGFVETIRHWIPPLRWKESCVLLKRD